MDNSPHAKDVPVPHAGNGAGGDAAVKSDADSPQGAAGGAPPVYAKVGAPGRQRSHTGVTSTSSLHMRKIHARSRQDGADHFNFEIDVRNSGTHGAHLGRTASSNRMIVRPSSAAVSQQHATHPDAQPDAGGSPDRGGGPTADFAHDTEIPEDASEIVSEEEFDLDDGASEVNDPNCDVAPIPVHQRPDFKWLILFGCFLTTISGFLNVVSIMSAQQTITHVSGSTSQAARRLIIGETAEFGNTVLLLGSFLMGSVISGASVGSNKFVLGHRYGSVMFAVGALILIGTFIMRSEDQIGDLIVRDRRRMAGLSLWALASGMQNAMCTSFSGAVIRTTHCTGMLTDIGMVLGHVVRHLFTDEGTGDVWKLRVLVPQYLSFFVGGLFAAWAHDDSGAIDTAFFPAGAMMTVGLLYHVLVAFDVFDDFLVEEKIEEEIAEVERKVVKALHNIYHQPSHVTAVRDAQRSRTSQNLDIAEGLVRVGSQRQGSNALRYREGAAAQGEAQA